MLETDASAAADARPGDACRTVLRSPQLLGSFDDVIGPTCRQATPALLAHEAHMTVTVERFHKSPVDVAVLDRQVPFALRPQDPALAQSDGRVVQYGIMRVNFAYLEPRCAGKSRPRIRRWAAC